jgi:hypothetical protein
LLGKIEQGQKTMQLYRNKSRLILVSFGSSQVYRFKKNNKIVANCHKIPQAQFSKHRLKVEDIVERWSCILDDHSISCSQAIWVFTVSPIRHLKDGFVSNVRSKSVLHLAVEELTKRNNAYYFPSYELMMDDLRDYRYYKEDMLHPSEQAIAYIWETFSNTFFSEELNNYLAEIHKLRRMISHRPRFPFGREYEILEQKLQEYKSSLCEKYPNKSKEISELQLSGNI